MKIATFNINNVNRRLANLTDWLKSSKPDVVCLQELKCADADFPAAAIKAAGPALAWSVAVPAIRSHQINSPPRRPRDGR